MFNLFKEKNQDSQPTGHRNRLKGEAIVSKTIGPHRPGQVFLRGTWWTAKSTQHITLELERIVEVVDVDIDNLTLLVEPVKRQNTHKFSKYY